MIAEDEVQNYETFRDCVSELLISKLSPSAERPKRKRAVKGRKNEIKPVDKPAQDESCDAADLSDTIEHLATEIFESLPAESRTLGYSDVQNDVVIAERYSLPLDTTVYGKLLLLLPLSVEDSLISYGLISEPSDLSRLLEPVLSTYIESATAAPPEFSPGERGTECEVCEREQLPLTYHHLIPRSVHVKAVKRGWHASWELNRVAWLCRPCHSFVHRCATNEELAKDLYSVDLLLEREDVQKWAAWVSKIRWRKK